MSATSVKPKVHLVYDSELMTNLVPGDSKTPTTEAQEVQSYTINVQCVDTDNKPVPSISALLQSSTPTSVNLNGQAVALSLTPVRYAFDETADICIIAPSTGVTTSTYTFSNFQDSNGANLDVPVTTIDPSRKVLQQFQNVKTGADLKNVPGRAGTTLYANKQLPAEADLNTAAKALNDLSGASATMPSTPTAVQAALNDLAKHPLPNDGWPAGHSTTSSQPANPATTTAHQVVHPRAQEKSLFHSIESLGSDIVHGGSSAVTAIKQGASSALDTAKDEASSALDSAKHEANSILGTLQKGADGVEHLVMKAEDNAGWFLHKGSWYYMAKLAGNELSFLIEKADDIGRACDRVLQEIKLGFEELENWAGFIFAWEGIIDTQKSLNSILTSTLKHWATNLKNNTFTFDGIFNALGDFKKSPPAPPKSTTAVGDITNNAQASAGGQLSQSTPAKWLGHQAKYHGAMDGTPAVGQSGAEATEDPWTAKVKPIIDTIWAKFKELGDDVVKKFGSSFDFSIADFVTSIGSELLDDFIDVLNKVVQTLLEFLGDMIDAFEKVGDAKINVPILSWIYRKITGEDLSLFGFMCLLLAIPTSIVHRSIMKVPFPHINFDSDLSGAIDSVFSRTEATISAPKPAASNVPAKGHAKFMVRSVETEPKDASDLNKASTSLAVATGWADAAIAAYEIFKVARSNARVVPAGGLAVVPATAFTKFTRFASPVMKITASAVSLSSLNKMKDELPAWKERIAASSLRLGSSVICGTMAGATKLDLPDSAMYPWKCVEGITTEICFGLGTAVYVADRHANSGASEEDLKPYNEQEAANALNLAAMFLDLFGWVANDMGDKRDAIVMYSLKLACYLARGGLLTARAAQTADYKIRGAVATF